MSKPGMPVEVEVLAGPGEGEMVRGHLILRRTEAILMRPGEPFHLCIDVHDVTVDESGEWKIYGYVARDGDGVLSRVIWVVDPHPDAAR